MAVGKQPPQVLICGEPQPPALGAYPLQQHQDRMRPCMELVWVKHRWLCTPCCHPSPPWVPVVPGPG